LHTASLFFCVIPCASLLLLHMLFVSAMFHVLSMALSFRSSTQRVQQRPRLGNFEGSFGQLFNSTSPTSSHNPPSQTGDKGVSVPPSRLSHALTRKSHHCHHFPPRPVISFPSLF
jgi:hypothetical protein